MSSSSFDVSSNELQELRSLVASFGMPADTVHASGTELRADAGPIVRIITIHGLSAKGEYSLAQAGDSGWLNELKRDLAAGLYRPG